MTPPTFLEFSAPTRIVTGLGSRARAGEELRRIGSGPVAVVCDAGVARAGLLDPIVSAIAVDWVDCGGIEPDPAIAQTEAAAAIARAAGCRSVLVVGGGSAIVAGKVVAVRLTNAGRIDAYEGIGRVPNPPAPCVAVPTTAGSGSEVSNVVVLHEPTRPDLLVVRGRGLEPDVAILDGELLIGLPREPFLDASLDALSHALESLWVRRATPFTDALALAAARTIRLALPPALEHRRPNDLQLLLEASTMANLACGSCGLGLVHALSSQTAVHVSHGRQNTVLLPHVATFNLPVVDREARREIEALDDLYRSLGIDARWRTGEPGTDAPARMVEAALDNPFRANNRREASEDDLLAILAATGADVTPPRAGIPT
ncbi:MAG: iron-containing alcohol dehydrogenase [Acidimicrobiia bacterium]|nr:iron-containing alcohol dehydrogenase [Acidimicrobiia bacterium]